jgi:hypothetical protein
MTMSANDAATGSHGGMPNFPAPRNFFCAISPEKAYFAPIFMQNRAYQALSPGAQRLNAVQQKSYLLRI